MMYVTLTIFLNRQASNRGSTVLFFSTCQRRLMLICYLPVGSPPACQAGTSLDCLLFHVMFQPVRTCCLSTLQFNVSKTTKQIKYVCFHVDHFLLFKSTLCYPTLLCLFVCLFFCLVVFFGGACLLVFTTVKDPKVSAK